MPFLILPTQILLALPISSFCFCGINQLWTKSIQEKNKPKKIPKSKTRICCVLVTIYIAFTLYWVL